MIYLELFWSFFLIGLFSVGGGYAAIALIQQQIVDVNGWMTMEEFGNLITLAEMTPGPIAINSSTFVGIQVGGMLGGIVATIGCVLPSCIIVSLLAFLYTKYKNLNAVQTVLAVLRPAVIGIIAFAGASILTLSIWGKNVNLTDADLFSAGIFILSLLAMIKFKKFSPMLVMLISGVAGILVYVLS
jgi:chromate transporter